MFLQEDWFRAFLIWASAVVATIVGFAFTIVWDMWKMRTEAAQRDNLIRNAIAEDLRANRFSVTRNLEVLKKELQLLAEPKTIVTPLSLLHTGFWDVAKINSPSKFVPLHKLIQLRKLVGLAEQVNEEVRSRENYRLHNEAMDNFSRRMKIYNNILRCTHERLAVAMNAYESNPKGASLGGRASGA